MKRAYLHRIQAKFILFFSALVLLGCSESSEEKMTDLKQKGTETEADPDPQVTDTLSEFEHRILKDLGKLENKPNYEVMHSINAIDLFSYFSGYYGGSHAFPCIFYNPEKNKLTVSAFMYQEEFKISQFDQALDSYLTILKNKGYEIDGETVDNNKYVWVNGKKMVYLEKEEIFPDDQEVKSHFTNDQYHFLYNEVGGWQGFSYLSGFGDTQRDYPLMVGVGYKETARLRVLGKGFAYEFTFDQVDSAFVQYREQVNLRAK